MDTLKNKLTCFPKLNVILISIFNFTGFIFFAFVLTACQDREFANPFDPQVPKKLTTSVLPSGAGAITVSPAGNSFKTDESVTLIPVPNQHWVFKNWEGDASGSSNPLSVIMNKNKSVVAIFIRRNYPLTLTMEGEGTVSEKIVFNPSGKDYPYSTIVELTPIPKQGWLFDSWSGDLSGKNVPQNITIDNPKTVRAKFVQQQISNLACASALNSGNLVASLPASGVSSAIPYTTVSGGAYIGQSITSTGVTGLTATLLAGNFAPISGNLNFTITGTPSGAGTASFAISIGGQTCTFTRVVNPLGTISGLNCGAATNNGALIVGAAASNVNSVIPYTGGNGSAHVGQIITSTGVTGLTATLAPGSFANGNGTLTYTITGTPSAVGTANFALSIGGQTCGFSRTVTTLAGTISSLNCAGASTSGVLNANQAASGVGGSIPYAGGNSGVHAGLTVSSSGVTGLTLTIASGTFANGPGVLDYTITGTPSGSGNANFALNIGGQTCTLTRVVNQASGSITQLNCSLATNAGTLTEGIVASGVSSTVPYAGGNGGTYSGQSVPSTGVTGLTATVASGSFVNGSSTLLYNITGTPSGSGTASFSLSIGGRTCALTRTVIASTSSTYPTGTVFCSAQTAIIPVTSPATGHTWMDRNLGASRAATSSTDSQAYGDLYQWGRRADGHQCRNSLTSTSLSASNTPSNANFIIAPNTPNDWRSPQNSNLWQGVSGINNPCPSGYRLPTTLELYAEVQVWVNKNNIGAISSTLKLPTANLRSHSSGVINTNAIGVYWSSTINGTDSEVLRIDNSEADFYKGYRAYGFSVRCIKN